MQIRPDYCSDYEGWIMFAGAGEAVKIDDQENKQMRRDTIEQGRKNARKVARYRMIFMA